MIFRLDVFPPQSTTRWLSLIKIPCGLHIPVLGPAIGMAQTGLCKYAMNMVDFFLSQINRRLYLEENATAVGNFSTLSDGF